ncbi:IclR family transcriptional regulator [Nocardioides sp. BGMRC 2183]|nr:IclR family transcriptional regulator [Nocardioides sp. BGMRC 2183]
MSMVERIALIMQILDEPGVRYRLDEVAVRAGLPRSTVHRILDQLLATGWVQRRTDGYALSAGATASRNAPSEHPELRSVAAPVLNRLHLDTGLAVHLGVLTGPEVLILDRVVGRSTIGLPTRVGGRVPAHATALGKAMLATLSPEDIDALFKPGITKRTPRTIGHLATLHQELGKVRGRRNLAYEDGEFVLGVSAMGVPITGSEGLVGAVSIGGMLPLENIERLGPLLLRAASHVSHKLADQTGVPEHPLPESDGTLGRLLAALPDDGWL